MHAQVHELHMRICICTGYRADRAMLQHGLYREFFNV